jgi:hypothetical protein
VRAAEAVDLVDAAQRAGGEHDGMRARREDGDVLDARRRGR